MNKRNIILIVVAVIFVGLVVAYAGTVDVSNTNTTANNTVNNSTNSTNITTNTSTSKVISVGEYSCTFTSSEIQQVKQGKQITKWTNKYDVMEVDGEIIKSKVYMSLSKAADDGETRSGQFCASVYSPDGGPLGAEWYKF